VNPSLPSRTETVYDLVTNLLDKGYTDTAGATMNAITANSSKGIVAQRLKELDAEAARLNENQQKLSPDNPVMRATLADFDTILRQNSKLIKETAPDLQRVGSTAAATLTRELAVPGVTDAELARFGVAWNTPDPEAVNALVGYATSPEWNAALDKYQKDSGTAVLDVAIRGFVNGLNPRSSARAIRESAESIPVYQANTLMRTLHLQSYRDATSFNQQANADILEGQVRIGVLDGRICLACLALHGTLLPVGQRITDHHNGRCTAVSIVKGRRRDIVTGEQWFGGLTIDQQRLLAGPANYEALRQGKVKLNDFVDPYEDPVFKEMMREASLKKILGDGAAEFYTKR